MVGKCSGEAGPDLASVRQQQQRVHCLPDQQDGRDADAVPLHGDNIPGDDGRGPGAGGAPGDLLQAAGVPGLRQEPPLVLRFLLWRRRLHLRLLHGSAPCRRQEVPPLPRGKTDQSTNLSSQLVLSSHKISVPRGQCLASHV